MAEITENVVKRVDDLDPGKPAVEAVEFSIGGTVYRLDLSETNLKRFRKDVETWTYGTNQATEDVEVKAGCNLYRMSIPVRHLPRFYTMMEKWNPAVTVVGDRVEFSVNGKRYPLNLSKKNRARFMKTMRPWMTAGTHRPRRSTTVKKPAVNPSDVRKWAIENGIPVGARGRLNQEVVDAYLEAS